MLRSIYVKGEVSNVKYHSSGHIYFTMKDNTGTLACVMFAGSRKGLGFTLKEGQQIISGGRIDVYEAAGKYQMYVQEIVLDGEGQLYERFEQLKRTLSEMGMFSEEYKKPIPRFINTLGVVTAPTGAAIQDIINITKRRNPHVRIILYPAQVQGDGAVPSIINGIRALENMGVDVMIVGRGGGSIEDLWAFNEEEVARAIFDCSIPVISAVGHETDTTIADFVADLRAPTPSAGAELAVFDYYAFMEGLRALKQDLRAAFEDNIDNKRARYEKLILMLQNLSPEHRLREQRMKVITSQERLNDLMGTRLINMGHLLDTRKERLNEMMRSYLVARRHVLDIRLERMEALSPIKRLSSGYAFVEKDDGSPLKSINQVEAGDTLILSIKDGKVVAEVKQKQEFYTD